MLVRISEAAYLVHKDQRAIRWHMEQGHLHAQMGADGHARIDTGELATVRGWRIDPDRLGELQEQGERQRGALADRLRVVEARLVALERLIRKTTRSDGQETGASEVGSVIAYPDAPNGVATPTDAHRAIRAYRGDTNTTAGGDTLPDDLVSAASFAEAHHVPRQTWVGAMRARRLPVVVGEWKQGRAIVRYALSSAGRAAVYRLWGDRADFTHCAACPHV